MRDRIRNILLEAYSYLEDVSKDIPFETWIEEMRNEYIDFVNQIEQDWLDSLDDDEREEMDELNNSMPNFFPAQLEEYMRDFYEEQVRHVDENDVWYDGDNIRIYRMMSVTQKWIDNFYRYREGTHLGVYWAHSDEQLEAYWGYGGVASVILEGRVSPDGVDWVRSFYCNTGQLSYENELRLYRGTPIKLVDIKVEDKFHHKPAEEIPNKDIALNKMYRA